jgi:hypothetical protein
MPFHRQHHQKPKARPASISPPKLIVHLLTYQLALCPSQFAHMTVLDQHQMLKENLNCMRQRTENDAVIVTVKAKMR